MEDSEPPPSALERTADAGTRPENPGIGQTVYSDDTKITTIEIPSSFTPGTSYSQGDPLM